MKDRLNNLRNSFAFIANLIVLILGLIIFSSMADRSLEISLISYIVVIVGAITSIFFIFKIDEPRLSEAALQKSLALREELLQTQESPRFSNDPNPEEMITLPAVTTILFRKIPNLLKNGIIGSNRHPSMFSEYVILGFDSMLTYSEPSFLST